MTGLTIARKEGESVAIGPNIVITIIDARGGTARINIQAPEDVKIKRPEKREPLVAQPATSG